MTKYREILRLTALGLSQRNVIQSVGVSAKGRRQGSTASPGIAFIPASR